MAESPFMIAQRITLGFEERTTTHTPWKGNIFIFNDMLPFQGAFFTRIYQPNVIRWAIVFLAFSQVRNLELPVNNQKKITNKY